MEAAYALAGHLVNIAYKDLPPEVVEVTKKQILDTIGTTLAGSTALGIRPLVDLTMEWGGKEESTIFSYGGKVPSFQAAQVNGAMAHALDYDEVHEDGRIHSSVSVVPAALAVAERRGNVTGREIILAVALGTDLACRMSVATVLVNPQLTQGGWHFTPLYGYFGCAATAGRLIGLDEEQMLNALGIAYHQSAGNLQCITDGAMTKRIGPGFAARGGIMAALLAERGITGARKSLEGEKGLFHVYHAGVDREKLLGELGKKFEGLNISFKPFPCCRLNHSYLDSTLQLVSTEDIKPDEIEEVTVTVHPSTNEIICTPPEVKYRPRSTIDCQFSLPWAMAAALVRRRVGLKEFSESSLKDERLRDMAQKIKPIVDHLIPDPHTPGMVTIKTKTRGVFSKQEKAILGSPKNPIGMDQLILKFKECASNAFRPLSEEKVAQLTRLILDLEKVRDVHGLLELLG